MATLAASVQPAPPPAAFLPATIGPSDVTVVAMAEAHRQPQHPSRPPSYAQAVSEVNATTTVSVSSDDMIPLGALGQRARQRGQQSSAPERRVRSSTAVSADDSVLRRHRVDREASSGSRTIQADSDASTLQRGPSRPFLLFSTASAERAAVGSAPQADERTLEQGDADTENPYHTRMTRLHTRVVQFRRFGLAAALLIILLTVASGGFQFYTIPLVVLVVFLAIVTLIYTWQRRVVQLQSEQWQEQQQQQQQQQMEQVGPLRSSVELQLEERLQLEAGRQTDTVTSHTDETDPTGHTWLRDASVVPFPPPTYAQAKRHPPPNRNAIREYESAMILVLSRLQSSSTASADHERPTDAPAITTLEQVDLTSADEETASSTVRTPRISITDIGGVTVTAVASAERPTRPICSESRPSALCDS